MRKRNVFLYFAFRPEKTIARAARYARQIQNACPDFEFVVLTYDGGQEAHRDSIDLNGLGVPHYVYGKAAAVRLPYPNKIGSQFSFKPLNPDCAILLFWRDCPEYERYWTIEDDVEYTGDLGKLISSLQDLEADLLATHIRNLPADWDYISKFRTSANGRPALNTCRLAFLPFHAVTNKALTAIDSAYRDGWAGQYEMTWPTILDSVGLPVADIGGNGPYVAKGHRGLHYIDLSPTDYQKHGSFGTKRIRLAPGRQPDLLWHPVKTIPDWARMSVKRGLSISKYLWRKYGIN
jgi:hypothetical protein